MQGRFRLDPHIGKAPIDKTHCDSDTTGRHKNDILSSHIGESMRRSPCLTSLAKALYDQSQSGTWAAPTTTTMGAQTLPMTLILTPWSMNVVIVQ